MKILHINSYFSGSSFYKNLYDRQVDFGLDIDVYVPVTKTYKQPTYGFGEYTVISKNHRELDRYIFHLKHNKIYRDVLQKYKIQEYTTIHAHSLFSNGYIAMKLKKQYGVPYIVAVRNTDVNFFLKKMVHLRRLGSQILMEASMIIFLSEAYKNSVIENYVPNKLKSDITGKSMVIPNGIDDFWIINKGVPKQLGQNILKLLYIGDINKNKNLLTTTKAINILLEKGHKVNYTVVGKIKDESIYSKIKKMPNVSYITPKSKEELIDIYRANDIFVMPSINETFGLVYAEAMSQGLPVIYSKGQGFDGQFSEGLVGLRANSRSAQDISEKICLILSEYNLFSLNAIVNVNKFEWNGIVKRYRDIYFQISEGVLH